MKEKLCKKVVEIGRKSDRVMALVLVFGKEVTRVMCVSAPQVGRSECEKDQFYIGMASKWDWKTLVKWFLVCGTSVDMLGDGLMVLRVCVVGMELAKEMLKKVDYFSSVMKSSCAWQIHGLKRKSREK